MAGTRDTIGPLRAREAALLAAMLAGKTAAEAGAAVGVPRSSAYRIAAAKNFQGALQNARSQMLESTIDRLRTIARGAVDTLEEVSTNAAPRSEQSADTKPIPAQARVSAAREALAALFRGIEIWEIERRLAKLESLSREGQK